MQPARWTLLFATVISLSAVPASFAATTSPAEQKRAEKWAAAKFAAVIQPETASGYLLPEGEGVELNGHLGSPLRIGSADYRSGLYMGKAGTIRIHLTSPATSLSATVGLDGRSFGCGYTNQQQQFSVQVADKTAAQSSVIRVGEPGIALKADLNGATEFAIQDHPYTDEDQWCQEGVWADARVLLKDGSTVALGNLPLHSSADARDTSPPFSFVYGGTPSSELLPKWRVDRTSHRIDAHRTEYDITYTNPHTGLIVSMIGKTYTDFPIVEWTLYFENGSDKDSPILEKISAIDTSFESSVDSEFTLHHFRGSPASPTDFEPFETTLGKGSTTHLATSGGRPTDQAMCYFNLADPGHGVIVGLGWPGQWDADFVRGDTREVRVRAGQELTHFKLLPHERVRTPLIALLFWNGGDWLRGQNLWRSWMLTDNVLPFSDGHVQPHLAAGSEPWLGEMVRATEENQKQFLDRYREIGIKPDFWWMDAGWYINSGHWSNTGTWTVDPKRFPNGLRPVSDYAHQMGIQTIVWFELERVTKGSALWEQHPDWLLRDPDQEKHGQRLLNLGNPDARKWVVAFLDKFITDQAIDVYRIDFNIAPLRFWRNNDAPDRQGITEILYVTGFLDYLDQLRKLHPHLAIDTCASGGRRDDLETLRRAVPMHRSDYGGEPVGGQNIGAGLAFWVPYYGAPNVPRDSYVFRSSWSPQINVGWDVRRTDLDYDWMRKSIQQWRSIATDYLGDYYPLIPYDPTDHAWMAWQFNRPDLHQGIVQVFRRARSEITSASLRLHDLDPNARYTLTDLDTGTTEQHSGMELQTRGVNIPMAQADSSKLFVYKKVIDQ